jgi:hypothetical protein
MAERPNESSTKYERLAREKRRIEAELSGLNLTSERLARGQRRADAELGGLNLARREIEKIRRLREDKPAKKWPSPGVH